VLIQRPDTKSQRSDKGRTPVFSDRIHSMHNKNNMLRSDTGKRRNKRADTKNRPKFLHKKICFEPYFFGPIITSLTLGKPNVRFDEGELEIEPMATTPALYSTESGKFEGRGEISEESKGFFLKCCFEPYASEYMSSSRNH